jgi:hypothetical protein
MLVSADFIASDYCFGIEMTAPWNGIGRGRLRDPGRAPSGRLDA